MCIDHAISRGLVKIQALDPARDPLDELISRGIYLHSFPDKLINLHIQVFSIKNFSFTFQNYAILFSHIKRCGT